jgi:C4-dicarboxylate transporter
VLLNVCAGGGFREGVTNVGAVDTLVLQSAKSEKKAQAGLFRTRGVGVIQRMLLATTSGIITDATGLFGLDSVLTL